jgi:hypothetical protein
MPMSEPDVASSDTRSAFREGVAAARANVLPGILLWGMAATLVLAYHRSPSVQAALGFVSALKTTYGFAFSALSTAVFGGLIPFLYLHFHPRSRAHNPWPLLGFYLALWGYRGMEVDALYRLQAFLFGDEASPAVIAVKVAVDQLLYNPLWSSPLTVLIFAWRDVGFRGSRLRGIWTFRTFVRATVRILVPTWMVWVPAVAVIYACPLPLQVPLFNAVLCFFMLLLAALPTETAFSAAALPEPGVKDRAQK